MGRAQGEGRSGKPVQGARLLVGEADSGPRARKLGDGGDPLDRQVVGPEREDEEAWPGPGAEQADERLALGQARLHVGGQRGLRSEQRKSARGLPARPRPHGVAAQGLGALAELQVLVAASGGVLRIPSLRRGAGDLLGVQRQAEEDQHRILRVLPRLGRGQGRKPLPLLPEYGAEEPELAVEALRAEGLLLALGGGDGGAQVADPQQPGIQVAGEGPLPVGQPADQEWREPVDPLQFRQALGQVEGALHVALLDQRVHQRREGRRDLARGRVGPDRRHRFEGGEGVREAPQTGQRPPPEVGQEPPLREAEGLLEVLGGAATLPQVALDARQVQMELGREGDPVTVGETPRIAEGAEARGEVKRGALERPHAGDPGVKRAAGLARALGPKAAARREPVDSERVVEEGRRRLARDGRVPVDQTARPSVGGLDLPAQARPRWVTLIQLGDDARHVCHAQGRAGGAPEALRQVGRLAELIERLHEVPAGECQETRPVTEERDPVEVTLDNRPVRRIALELIAEGTARRLEVPQLRGDATEERLRQPDFLVGGESEGGLGRAAGGSLGRLEAEADQGAARVLLLPARHAVRADQVDGLAEAGRGAFEEASPLGPGPLAGELVGAVRRPAAAPGEVRLEPEALAEREDFLERLRGFLPPAGLLVREREPVEQLGPQLHESHGSSKGVPHAAHETVELLADLLSVRGSRAAEEDDRPPVDLLLSREKGFHGAPVGIELSRRHAGDVGLCGLEEPGSHGRLVRGDPLRLLGATRVGRRVGCPGRRRLDAVEHRAVQGVVDARGGLRLRVGLDQLDRLLEQLHGLRRLAHLEGGRAEAAIVEDLGLLAVERLCPVESLGVGVEGGPVLPEQEGDVAEIQEEVCRVGRVVGLRVEEVRLPVGLERQLEVALLSVNRLEHLEDIAERLVEVLDLALPADGAKEKRARLGERRLRFDIGETEASGIEEERGLGIRLERGAVLRQDLLRIAERRRGLDVAAVGLHHGVVVAEQLLEKAPRRGDLAAANQRLAGRDRLADVALAGQPVDAVLGRARA